MPVCRRRPDRAEPERADLAGFPPRRNAALDQCTSLDHDHGSVLTLRLQRALAARYLGHKAEAETETGDVLADRLRILGADHRIP